MIVRRVRESDDIIVECAKRKPRAQWNIYSPTDTDRMSSLLIHPGRIRTWWKQ